jgi:hypothetical protein
LFTAFFIEVGLLLVILPWSGLWEENYFPQMYPWLRTIITNNFVRGAMSGLGVVNLYAAYAELMPAFSSRHPYGTASSIHTPVPPYGGPADTRVEP